MNPPKTVLLLPTHVFALAAPVDHQRLVTPDMSDDSLAEVDASAKEDSFTRNKPCHPM